MSDWDSEDELAAKCMYCETKHENDTLRKEVKAHREFHRRIKAHVMSVLDISDNTWYRELDWVIKEIEFDTLAKTGVKLGAALAKDILKELGGVMSCDFLDKIKAGVKYTRDDVEQFILYGVRAGNDYYLALAVRITDVCPNQLNCDQIMRLFYKAAELNKHAVIGLNGIHP